MFITLLALSCVTAPAVDPSVEFFKPVGKIPTIKVEIDKENLALLRKEPRKAVRATLKMGDEKFTDVGLHLKGQAGSYREWNDRPALTINSNTFKKGQYFHGLDKFHLNNSVQDDCYMNELLTGELFRAAGVPCARTTHAVVELNGRKVGMYVLKEGFDTTFLKHHFIDTSGNLYDGGFLSDIDQGIELKSGTDVGRKDCKELAAIARTEDKKARYGLLDEKLDLDKYYALWVIEVLCCDWDGYSRNRNNYKVYFDPTSGKCVMFAHGKDQMFQNTRDPLVTRWGGLFSRKLYETDEGKKRYVEEVKSIFEKHFDYDKLTKIVDDYAKRIQEKLNDEAKGDGDEWYKRMKGYNQRLKARIEYIKKELPKLK